MEAALAVAPEIRVAPACRALGVSRATAYRHRSPKPASVPRARRRSPRALSNEERARVLAELHSERFGDAAPAAVYATLLDEGTYLASERTMYRIVAANREVRELCAQLRHPAYAAPELLATAPNELWSCACGLSIARWPPSKTQLTGLVVASGSSLPRLRGIGVLLAAKLLGEAGDVRRLQGHVTLRRPPPRKGAPAELLPIGPAVLVAEPADDPAPDEGAQVAKGRLRHPVPEVGGPAPEHRVDRALCRAGPLRNVRVRDGPGGPSGRSSGDRTKPGDQV
jgi:hypothetical protein